jgi:predicted dehydrogenase
MSGCLMGLVGIGGFGRIHVNAIRNLSHNGLLRCVAFCESKISGNEESYNKLLEMGAKHYTSYEQMMRMHPEMDFITIATPIHLHKNMGIQAMEDGFHVLLEKPPAVTIQDIDAIIEVQKRTGKYCAVDFQNISGEAFQLLLEKIGHGELGEITQVTGVGMWKRTRKYYERSPWVGKSKINGEYVLDGTLSNPFAHLVQNCLIVAGDGDAANAIPEWIQAELYRANEIEGEDTACTRIQTSSGVEVKIYTTVCHCVNETPYILIKGTKGQAMWNYRNQLQMITDHEEKNYQYEEKDTPRLVANIYKNLIQSILEPSQSLFAPIQSCRNFILTLNGAYESSKGTHRISDPYVETIQENESIAIELRDVKSLFEFAVTEGKMFSEVPIEWAVKTLPFRTTGYEKFTLFSDQE